MTKDAKMPDMSDLLGLAVLAVDFEAVLTLCGVAVVSWRYVGALLLALERRVSYARPPAQMG